MTIYLFRLHHMAYEILVPQVQIKPVCPAVEAWSTRDYQGIPQSKLFIV